MGNGFNLLNLHVIFFDVDGVFTDGKSWQDSSGQWRRTFSVRDTMAIRALRKAGYRVAVLTAAHSAEIKDHFNFVGVDDFKDHCVDQMATADQILRAYGLKKEHAGFVTEDADGTLRFAVGGATLYTTARRGGDGAVLEISNLILQHGHERFKNVLNP